MAIKTIDPTRELSSILDLLTSIAGRILQMSDRKASVALGAATNTVFGSAFVASVFGTIGSLGAASTGTAIAGLSGAAKTTATLYWVGGLVGGGVTAGTLVLGAGALGVGIYGSMKVRRAILGQARRKDTLSEQEVNILEAINSIVSTIRTVLRAGAEISVRELELLSRVGMGPLLTEIEEALINGRFDDLKTYNRARLRGHVINLRSLQKKLGHE
jgi:hypothetical protein